MGSFIFRKNDEFCNVLLYVTVAGTSQDSNNVVFRSFLLRVFNCCALLSGLSSLVIFLFQARTQFFYYITGGSHLYTIELVTGLSLSILLSPFSFLLSQCFETIINHGLFDTASYSMEAPIILDNGSCCKYCSYPSRSRQGFVHPLCYHACYSFLQELVT